MKSWLKGGVIAVVLFAILAILAILLLSIRIVFIPGGIILLILDLLFLGGTVYSPSFQGVTFTAFSVLLSALVYFFIGALIGWIVGRNKDKENKK